LTTLHELEDGGHYYDLLQDEDLIHILTKLPNEAEGSAITAYDQDMSAFFIMQQLNKCIQSPSDFMYEVTGKGRRTIIDVDGKQVPITRNAYDPSNAGQSSSTGICLTE
jgi:hypothetical protein